MSTPIFHQVAAERKTNFKAFPSEYTDRFTPEVARHQGFVSGYNQAIGNVLTLLAEAGKPKMTKQLEEAFQAVSDLELAE